jgi:rhodanese-related sulfurtransferase
MVVGAILIVICAAAVYWIRRERNLRQLEEHSITPEALHALLDSNREVLLFDVRRPLDLLVDSEIIPGATRIPPKVVIQNPLLIPRDRDAVFYCTCPGDETARRVVRQALAMQLTQVKLLKGGLPAWKAKGFTVVPYDKPFHLDVRS